MFSSGSLFCMQGQLQRWEWHYLGGTSYIPVPPMITLASHGMALFCRLPLVMQSLSASGCLVHCARDVGEHVDIAGLMRCV